MENHLYPYDHAKPCNKDSKILIQEKTHVGLNLICHIYMVFVFYAPTIILIFGILFSAMLCTAFHLFLYEQLPIPCSSSWGWLGSWRRLMTIHCILHIDTINHSIMIMIRNILFQIPKYKQNQLAKLCFYFLDCNFFFLAGLIFVVICFSCGTRKKNLEQQMPFCSRGGVVP